MPAIRCSSLVLLTPLTLRADPNVRIFTGVMVLYWWRWWRWWRGNTLSDCGAFSVKCRSAFDFRSQRRTTAVESQKQWRTSFRALIRQ
eukprot:SAG22_NODE_1042_length_5883_cov_129.108575_7_plen_88_part_00